MIALAKILLPQPNLHGNIALIGRFELHASQAFSAPLRPAFIYLRKLLIHGARAALPVLASSGTPLGQWLRALMQRVHKNVAVVALANKLARIAWSVLRHNKTFDTHLEVAAI